MAYDYYLYDLKRSPLFSNYATIVAILVPAAELLVAGLILPDKTSKAGLVGSLGLMALFTLYVGYVLLFAGTRPCTCGGIIRNLTWPQHLIFNLVFLILSFAGLYLHRMSESSTYISRGTPKNH